jgi:dTDP-4-dehydrorhamnose reductase
VARVLVTGASGLLGGRLAQLLASSHDVVAMRHRAPVPVGLRDVEADILDAASLERALAIADPEVVVHAAAEADADRCQADPDRARRYNVEASIALARLCRRRSAQLMALSTDLVVPGDRAMSPEDAPVATPALVYGRTKLEAEEAVLAEAPGAAVLRVALVLGRGFGPRTTASEGIASALATGRRLRLYTDQFRTPVDAESVADAIDRLIARSVSGRFHLAGPERLSRYDLGLRVARVLALPVHGIDAVTQADQPASAPRPADASLDTSRARRELGWSPRPLDDAIGESRHANV